MHGLSRRAVWPLVVPPGDSGPIDRLVDKMGPCPQTAAAVDPDDPTTTTFSVAKLAVIYRNGNIANLTGNFRTYQKLVVVCITFAESQALVCPSWVNKIFI